MPRPSPLLSPAVPRLGTLLRQRIRGVLGVAGAVWVAAALGACGGGGGPGAGDALSAAVSGRKAAERPAAIAHDPLRAEVVRVVDGDTIDARIAGGAIQRVRLIGIDTPEKYTTRTGYVECGGESASKATRVIAARWPAVTLRPDRSQDAYDTYGRLLAYVQPDAAPATTYQQAILADGWASVYVYDGHPFQRVAAFRQAAAAARAAGRGVWQQCGGEFRKPLGP